jgi:hypothetical protein
MRQRKRKDSHRNPITFRGKYYPNRSALSRVFGVDPKLVTGRCSAGWTLDQALNLSPHPKKGSWRDNAVLIDGRAYPKGRRGVFKLYLVTCIPTNKKYVGITVSSLDKRWGEHVSNAIRHSGGNSKLYRAIRKHGKYAFCIELLRKDAKDYKELLEQEQKEVKSRNTYKTGLNSTAGGETPWNLRPVIVEGIEYVTIAAASDIYGVPEYLARSRLDSLGWTTEQAFEIAPRPTEWGPKRLTLNGNSYPSIKDACRSLGIAYSKVNLRLSRYGWSFEQAFDLLPSPADRPSGAPRKIQVGHMVFASLAKAGKHFGLSEGAVSSRLSSGWSVEQAVGLEPPPEIHPPRISVVVEGQKFESIRTASAKYNIDYKLVHGRLQSGWTIEQAFALESRPKPISKGKSVTVRGITHPSLRTACDHHKVPYVTFKQRKRKGYSIEEALGLKRVKRRTNGKAIKIKGKTYPSLTEACEAFKLPLSRVGARLTSGWSVNEAFGLCDRAKQASNGKTLVANGQQFSSIKAACKHFGVSYQTYRLRRNRGLSVDQSLSTLERKTPPNASPITVKGIRYSSISRACEKFGFPLSRVRSRYMRGATTRQAFKEAYEV